MNPKYIKYILYAVVLIIIMAVGFYFGRGIEAGITSLLIFLGLKKSNKEKLKDAKENINKAGEDIEATEHDSDSALNKLDDIVSDNDSTE
ncbi:MAG: hypothetical protein ACQEQF_11030 [Bacillota bacterium]